MYLLLTLLPLSPSPDAIIDPWFAAAMGETAIPLPPPSRSGAYQ